jgi:hypothetical protein
MTYLINAGTGVVADASEAQAVENIAAFVTELALEGVEIIRRNKQRDEGGRFHFKLVLGTRKASVLMPGASLATVRDERSIFQPRLYVNGSSWWWPYAISVTRATLLGSDE